MSTSENQPPTVKLGSEVDMSPAAIDLRLRKVSQLYKLGMAIRTARVKPNHVAERSNNCVGQPSSPEVG